MKTITVIPNPFIALDHEGVPQGVVSAGVPGVYVGAFLDLVASRKTGKSRFYFPPNADGSFTRKVMFTSEIVTSVQAGELLAADKASALMCGITEKQYLEIDAALEAEKKKALDYWTSVKGPDAKLGDMPTQPMEDPLVSAAKASVEVTPGVTLTMSDNSNNTEG